MDKNKGKVILNGLLNKLVNRDHISYEKAMEAQKSLPKKGFNLAEFLVGGNLISSMTFAEESSKEFNLPYVDLEVIDFENLPESVEHKLCERYKILPLEERGSNLYIASSDPIQDAAIVDIGFSTRKKVHLIIVEHDKLEVALSKFLDRGESVFDNLDDEDIADFDLEDDDNEEEDVSLNDVSDSDSPIVKLVNKLLFEAVRKKASDIHFEPYEKKMRVRYRMDGILEEITFIPMSSAATVAARIKVMAQLDIAERRSPQDGRIKMKISKRKSVDFRVSTLPTVHGEKLVLRILDGEAASYGAEAIEMLGFEPDQKKLYLEALSRPQGMILVTGPTGSGKTVSLYTGLNILNTPERNISTAEDPVEINVDGINQVHINPKAGLEFADALRSFLRQDPDIIMVGEIRDLETAEISIKAAQTGHLVLSTLHTNSAAETLSRLNNMGVPLFNVATAVHLIMAQRLARKLCENCKEKIDIPFDILKEEGITQDMLEELNATFYRANNCDSCTNGYKGRVGIYEVVPMTKELSSMVMNGANAFELAKQMREHGFHSLRRSAMIKAMKGLISLDEVYRVTTD